MTARLLAVCTACCAAIAAASLAFPGAPVYDAWAWLIWGRELAGGGLDLSSGPSWKPLPAGIAAVLSVAGDAAPELWLVLVRSAWLLAIVLAAELAYRLTLGHAPLERMAAAAFAATSLLLLSDPITAWLRQGAGGMSEPLLVALVLGAVRAGIDGRHRIALVLAALGALLRPEIWPLLALYGLWLWRSDRALRPYLASIAVTIPALWLGPDLLSAGDALSGAERAQRSGGSTLDALADVFEHAARLPLGVAWPLAALAVIGRAPRMRLLAAGVLGWIAIVLVMTVAGFWGLPRFMTPAAAIVGVLGGVGLAHLLAAVRGRGTVLPAVALAALVLGLAAQVGLRGYQLRDAAVTIGRVGDSHDRLRAVTREAGGLRALMRCGRMVTSDVLLRPALAWELDAPLHDVTSFGRSVRLYGSFVIGPKGPARGRRVVGAGAELLARRGEWSVYSLPCAGPATAGTTAAASPAATSAGVSGARR